VMSATNSRRVVWFFSMLLDEGSFEVINRILHSHFT
jgi:hypothetical protein